MSIDSPNDRAKAMEAIETFFEYWHILVKKRNFKGHDRKLLEDLRLIDADSKGNVVWELTIDENWGNMNGVLHGGAYGVIFDMCTAIALNTISRPGYWDFLGGVTRSLNISYLKAVPTGTTVRIRTEVAQTGRIMAFIRGVMESVDGSKIYATVEHHKVHTDGGEWARGLWEYRKKRAEQGGAKL